MSTCAVVSLFSLLYLLPVLAIALTSIIIGATHAGATCDDHSLVPLSTWLIVYGSVSIAFAFLMVIAILLLFSGNLFLAGMLTIVGFLFIMFNIAWNIIGAVSLFRDSMSCMGEDGALWIMTLVVLILQWIGFLGALTSRSRE